MGMLISVAHKSNKIKIDRPLFYFVAGSICFLLIAGDVVLQLNLLIECRTVLYGLASSMIIFGLVKAEDNGRIIGNQKWVQQLGNSSYVLYLIHFPLISILCKLSLYVRLDYLGLVGAMISYIVIFVSCLISAVVFNIWIEKPVISYLRKYRI